MHNTELFSRIGCNEYEPYKFHRNNLSLALKLADVDFDRREKFADIILGKSYDPNVYHIFVNNVIYVIDKNIIQHNCRYLPVITILTE